MHSRVLFFIFGNAQNGYMSVEKTGKIQKIDNLDEMYLYNIFTFLS